MPLVGLRVTGCALARVSNYPITADRFMGHRRRGTLGGSSLTNWLDSLYNRINDP